MWVQYGAMGIVGVCLEALTDFVVSLETVFRMYTVIAFVIIDIKIHVYTHVHASNLYA